MWFKFGEPREICAIVVVISLHLNFAGEVPSRSYMYEFTEDPIPGEMSETSRIYGKKKVIRSSFFFFFFGC
jgi:hypothetical protein